MRKKHIEIKATGMVQGVGYRLAAKKTAQSLNLKGWVKNQTDGSVIAVVEGPETEIRKFINWCHRGPMLANVEELTVSEGRIEGYQTFEVRH